MLHARLEFRQSQSLIITPQLQQAIKLLQLSNLDLLSFVAQEIEQNPLLEWDERPQNDNALPAESGDGGEAGISPEFKTLAEQDRTYEASLPKEAALAESGDFTDDAPVALPAAYETLPVRSGAGSLAEGTQTRLEDLTPEQSDLHDLLRHQFYLETTAQADRLIGDHLIDLIDEAGYMRGSLEEIAIRLGASQDRVEAVLAVIQNCAPAGIGARSLAECLALQLQERNRLDPVIQTMLDNLVLLGDHDYAGLKRLCGVDDEDLAEMIAEIRALNPRPGVDYGYSAIPTVIPDIVVELGRSGEWEIQLNDETLPRIRVNQDFYVSTKGQIQDEKGRSFLQDCMANANWLTRSLDQRRQTMLKVAYEIVRCQKDFLHEGVQGLRPLALKNVAEKIGMHESTVSRVTSNKYMQTPRGTFELKYFFTSAIAAADEGDAHSSEAVKHRIKELIDNEAPRKILSDDKIVAILRESGIDIARRTVAKYRDALKIPSSVQRRKQKNAICARI